LRHGVDGREIAGLAVFETAVQARRQLEAPPLLIRIGDLDGYPLFDAGDVDESALQKDLYAARARIGRVAGMAERAGASVIAGAAGDTRRGSVTMSESDNRHKDHQPTKKIPRKHSHCT